MHNKKSNKERDGDRVWEIERVRERGVAAQSCCQLPTEEEQILRTTWPPKRGAIRVNFVLQAEAADEAEAVAVAGHPVGSGGGVGGEHTYGYAWQITAWKSKAEIEVPNKISATKSAKKKPKATTNPAILLSHLLSPSLSLYLLITCTLKENLRLAKL